MDPGLLAHLTPEVGLNTSPAKSIGETVHFEEGRVVLLLHLGLQCCLLDPEFRPSMRVVKQVIRQLLQNNTVVEEDPILVLQWMPPLPSTMPLLGGSTTATEVDLEEVEARVIMPVRRRFATN